MLDEHLAAGFVGLAYGADVGIEVPGVSVPGRDAPASRGSLGLALPFLAGLTSSNLPGLCRKHPELAALIEG